MQSIIGVYHDERNLDVLIDHIIIRHGTPKEVMLELPIYWREVRDKPVARTDYFYKIAETFEKRGSIIIPGDINHNLIVSRKLYDMIDDEYSQKADTNLEKISLLKRRLLALIAEATVSYNLWSEKKCEQRNEGFLRVFEETKPLLTIIGNAHAQYIMKKFPDLDYTLFRSNTFLENIEHCKDMLNVENVRPKREIVAKV